MKRSMITIMFVATLLAALSFTLAQNPPPPNSQFGAIAGKLLAMDGTPAANVRVSAQLVDTATQENGTALLSITQTDAAGRYRLENVRPGRYFIIAGLVDSPSYFPGVGDRAGATIVTIGTQETLSDLDFRMAIPTGVRFSGRIVRQNGDGTLVTAATAGAAGPPFALVAGAPGSQLAQIRLNGGTGGVAAPIANVAPDGSFEFSNVRPGRYDVLILQLGAGNPRISITIVDKDVSDFQLIVPFMVAVSGTVAMDGGGPLPRLQLDFIRSAGAQALPQGATPALVNPRISVGTAFTSQLQSGEYKVSATGVPAGFVLKSITSGNADLASNILKVTDGIPPIKIVLGVLSPPPWVRLAGHVVGRVERYRVVNFNVTNQVIADQLEPDFYLDGSFEIPKALPGQYVFRTSTIGSPMMNSTIIVGNADVNDGVIYVPDEPTSASTSEPSENVRVSGRIVGRARTGSGARVRLTDASFGETLSTPILMDGSFEFLRVPPGTYAAEVFPAVPGALPTTVVVSGTEVRDLRVTVPDTREIAGRVLASSEVPVPRSMEISVGTRDKLRFPISPDGTFSVTLPAGQRIAVSPGSIPSAYVVESMKYGAEDLIANPLAFTGLPTDELRVTLRAAAPLAGIKGRVVGSASLPSGSHVWLTDPAGSLRTVETRINPDGTFEFAKVASGRYIVRLGTPGIAATAAPIPVVVSGSDVAGVEIALPR